MNLESFQAGLPIVAVGIGGVFANLVVLMLAMYGIGLVFGKKKKKKKPKSQENEKKPEEPTEEQTTSPTTD